MQISKIFFFKSLYLVIYQGVSEDKSVSHCAIFGHIFVPDKHTKVIKTQHAERARSSQFYSPNWWYDIEDNPVLSRQLKSRAACAIRLAYFAKMINSTCFPLFKSNAALEIITTCISSKFENIIIQQTYHIINNKITQRAGIISLKYILFTNRAVCNKCIELYTKRYDY